MSKPYQTTFFEGNSEVSYLSARIRNGTRLLWERWGLVMRAESDRQRDKLIEGFDKGKEKLAGLCEQLKHMGGDCPYRGEPPTGWCFACPVPNGVWKRENCPAWGLEL